MKKTTINIKAAIKKMDKAMEELKEGIPTAKLSKKAKEEIREDLEEVIALAEQLKIKNEIRKAS